MSHEFNSGAFYQVGAWHGLGTVVQERLNTADFLKAAGMDWQVEMHPLYDQDGNEVQGWKQLKRSDTQELLHVARASWTPLQNQDAFRWFDPFIQDQDMYLSAAVSLKAGRRIAITAEFAAPVVADVVPNDTVSLKLVLFNSHDGSLAVGIKFTPIRVVCANTLAMVVQGTKQKFQGDIHVAPRSASVKHTKNVLANLSMIREQIDLATRTFKTEVVPQYQAMSATQLSTQLWKQYLAYLFEKDVVGLDESLRAYDALTAKLEAGLGQDIPGVRGTMWAAYNAVTEWVSHKPNKDSLLFGSYAKTIEKAHKLALSLS